MIFIDGSNLFHSLGQARIDYRRLVEELVAGRNLIQAFHFCSLPPNPRQTQIDFHNKLRALGLEVKVFPLRLRNNTLVEKGVDVAMAVEFLIQAYNRNFDVGVLVTGDEDFKGVVSEAKRLGRKVEIAAIQAACGKEFQLCGNKFVPLEPIIQRAKLPGKP